MGSRTVPQDCNTPNPWETGIHALWGEHPESLKLWWQGGFNWSGRVGGQQSPQLTRADRFQEEYKEGGMNLQRLRELELVEDFQMANIVGRQHMWFELLQKITWRKQNHLSRAIRGKGEQWASASLCLHLLGKKEGSGSWDSQRETWQWISRWVSCAQTQCMECQVLQKTLRKQGKVTQRKSVEPTDLQHSF